MNPKWSAVIIVGCLLTSCATNRWVKPGSTEADAELAAYECRIAEVDVQQCMEGKGYVLMKK